MLTRITKLCKTLDSNESFSRQEERVCQVEIDPEQKMKTTFSSGRGLYATQVAF